MRQKFFMLLAAVLLSSTSVFAQSGNNEPLKGDVNGDGVVDVADIAAVIAIIKNNAQPQTTYYFSVGTTEVTSSNYTTVNNATTTIPSTYTYTSTERNYTYLVVPSNKTVTMVDKNTNANYTLIEQTTINISNHKVYKGPAVAVGAQAIITLS